VCAGLALLATASARETWITARTAHFEMFSNASESESREMLNKLEQFRAALLALCSFPQFHDSKTTIVLFATGRQFDACRPLLEGKPASAAACVIGDADETLVATSADHNPEQTDQIIFQEYLQRMITAGGEEPPLWLSEGLAELFSTFRIEGDSFILGAGKPAPAGTSGRLQWMPQDQLFALTRESPEYHGEVFHAESWALIHFMICSKDSAVYLPRLRRFNELLAASDGTIDRIFQEAFSMSYEEMTRNVDRYLQGDHSFAQRGKLILGDLSARIEFKPAGDFAREVALNDLRWRLQAPGNAADQLRQSSESHPAEPRPHEILAALALKGGDRNSAFNHWRCAAEAGSDNPEVYLQLAADALDHLMIGLSLDYRMPGDQAATLRRWLDQAIALSPRDLEAYEKLAMVEAFSEWPRFDVVNRVQAVVPKMRDKTRAWFAIAVLRWRMGDDAAARQIAKSLLATPTLSARLRFLTQRLNWRLNSTKTSGVPAEGPP
jgi:hypothetical protein